MISLRNAIAQQREELLHSALDCCRAVAESGARVSGASAAGDFSRTEEEIGRELEGWCTRASEYYRRKASEIRDVMVAMNEAAKSVADRDERHALHATAQVDRTGLEDGRQSVACLKTQLAAYEQRLEEAERASNADALTGLLIRAGTPFCMVVFDLNGFKEINDTHGHTADDALLKAFAKEFGGSSARSMWSAGGEATSLSCSWTVQRRMRASGSTACTGGCLANIRCGAELASPSMPRSV